MSFIIQYVATYAPWIYATCGLVALYQIYRIWLVRGERRQAVFSLEREKATQDIYRIFYSAMILVLAMGLTYFTSTVLANAVEPLLEEALAPTPEIPFVPTPTNTPLPATPTPTVTPTAPPTVESAPEPVEVPTATPDTRPVVQAPVCPDSRALFLRPGNNETLTGVITVVGTANHEQFQYYKIEYAPGANASGGYVYAAGGNSPVINNVLGNIDTRGIGNGTWTLQLIVVDQTGNFPPPCRVTVNIQN